MLPLIAIMAIVFSAGLTGFALQEIWGFHALEANSWKWVWDYSLAYGHPPYFLVGAIFGAFLAAIAILLAIRTIASRAGARSVHGERSSESLHGTARWANRKDIGKAGLLDKKGVVIGGIAAAQGTRTLYDNGPQHILAFAPTGSGKGVSLVVPSLLSWTESVLVLDIKGENWRLTSGWRASQGQKIFRFDPTADGGHRFNPLAEIRVDSDHQIADAQNVAMMIIDPDGKGLADFWAKSGYSWLTGTILYTLRKVRVDENRTASLSDVDRILTAIDEGGVDNFLDSMLAIKTGHPETDLLIHSSAQEMKDRSAQERSGVQSSAKVDLALYRDPIIARNISASDFRLSDLMNGDAPASLYLIVPPSDIDRLRPLLRVILNLFMRRLLQNVEADGRPAYRHRLLLMLDEFTSIGKLEIFDRSLAFMRGYGIKGYLIIQDLPQLSKEYGRENGIMGNCNIQLAFAPNEIATAKTLSDKTGVSTIVQVHRDQSKTALALFGTVTDRVQEVSRPLLTADECMRLRGAQKSRFDATRIVKPGDMLIFTSGQPPILGRQPLYFLEKRLLARTRLPPVGKRVESTTGEKIKAVVPTPDENPAIIHAESACENFADRIRRASGKETSHG